jgi:hypothetical protein
MSAQVNGLHCHNAFTPPRTADVIPMTWRTLCSFQNMIKLTDNLWGKLCRMDNWLFIWIY